MKMDETRRIADKLNRGYYSVNVLKYFFDKPDADSEDECSDSNNESDCITLENIPNLQLTLAEDEDEEESLGLASDELDRKISDAISTVTSEEDVWRQTDHSPHLGADHIHHKVQTDQSSPRSGPHPPQGPDRETPDHLVHWRQRCLQEYFSVSYGVSFHKHPSYTFALCVHSKYT